MSPTTHRPTTSWLTQEGVFHSVARLLSYFPDDLTASMARREAVHMYLERVRAMIQFESGNLAQICAIV